jgi:hypothetical protein
MIPMPIFIYRTRKHNYTHRCATAHKTYIYIQNLRQLTDFVGNTQKHVADTRVYVLV